METIVSFAVKFWNMDIVLNHIRFADDTLQTSLRAICEFQKAIFENEKKDTIHYVDFKNISFVSPLWIVCAKIFLSSRNIECRNLSSYLETIKFDEPFDGTDMDSVKNKSYFPLTQFITSTGGKERDSVISVIEDLIVKNTNIESNIISAIKYLFSELTDNILEHSKAAYGYIYSQFFPQKRFIDIVIADNGNGLLQSYLSHGFPIHTEEEAMRAVNNRKSTKDRPNAENRGYGIYSSKNILCKGLGGEFSLLSGQIIYHKTREKESYLKLPDPFRIQGTAILSRIPCQPNKQFNISNFLE